MQIPIKPYVARLYVASLILFVLNKLLLRPLLAGAAVPRWVEVVSYSSPNLIEAVTGTTTVTVLLFVGRRRFLRLGKGPSNAVVYALGAVLAGTYVLTQEFKLHNLGGRNVYDPADAVASVIGVVLMWWLFLRYGLMEDVSSRVRNGHAGE